MRSVPDSAGIGYLKAESGVVSWEHDGHLYAEYVSDVAKFCADEQIRRRWKMTKEIGVCYQSKECPEALIREELRKSGAGLIPTANEEFISSLQQIRADAHQFSSHVWCRFGEIENRINSLLYVRD